MRYPIASIFEMVSARIVTRIMICNNKNSNTLLQDSIINVKIMWDLELLEFTLVVPTFLLERPCKFRKNLSKLLIID